MNANEKILRAIEDGKKLRQLKLEQERERKERLAREQKEQEEEWFQSWKKMLLEDDDNYASLYRSIKMAVCEGNYFFYDSYVDERHVEFYNSIDGIKAYIEEYWDDASWQGKPERKLLRRIKVYWSEPKVEK